MKIAQYGITIVVIHAIVHGLHGFAIAQSQAIERESNI